jgi:hypothetical protein
MLHDGSLRFLGTPDEFRSSDDRVVRAFLDRSAAYAALDEMETV